MKKMKKYLFLECSGKKNDEKNEKILVLGMLREKNDEKILVLGMLRKKKMMKKMKKYY